LNVKTVTSLACSTLFLIGASAVHAAPECIAVDGTVSSTAILCAQIPQTVTNLCPAGVVDPEQPQNFVPGMCLPEIILPGEFFPRNPVCFRISGKGKARIRAADSYSRLTTEVAANEQGQFAATPLVFPPQVAGNPRADLTAFTSNASLTGRVRNLQGTLWTRDTGVITADGIVGQVLKVVGGPPGSDFERATGTLAVAGQEVGGAAFYTGEICVPR
jgi:hypothetical protein